jgi:plastocyanin
MVVNATGNASFVPAEITIDPGTQVIDESNLSFEHVFNVAGQTYDYFCEPHEVAGMTGKVTVR